VTTDPSNDAPYRLIVDVEFDDSVIVQSFTNLYGCAIGANTRIGPFVEVQHGATIGENCKISSHTFICSGVEIEDNVFVGHGVIFVNDKYPAAVNETGTLKSAHDWTLLKTKIRRGASLGSGAVILGGVEIGENALVGAGSVVTHNVYPGEVVAGSPARKSAGALATTMRR
jgi:acetyltransferase-like isoleucine patch superfamily enzyme